MALVGIMVGISDVGQLLKLPLLKLPEGCIELSDPPVLIWRKADFIFKQALKGSFRQAKFLLCSNQRIIARTGSDFFRCILQQSCICFYFRNQAVYVIIEQG